MPDGYLRHREAFQSISGQVFVDSVDVTVIPIVGAPFYTIYIQRFVVDVNSAGAAGTQWQFTDTNGTVMTAPIPVDATGQIVRDFGSKGVATKEGEGIQITADPGASGNVTWEGYKRLTGVGAT